MDDKNPTTGSDSKPTERRPASVALTEETPAGESTESTARPRASFRSELALATIQHANRSLVILLIAFMVAIGTYCGRKQLSNLLANAKSIKAGGFEIELQEAAVNRGVAPEFARLAGLNDQQLQLFLIAGKKRGSNAAGTDDISYTGEEVTKENLYKLQEIGLLTGIEEFGDKRYRWQVTDKGVQLHELLRGQIVISVREAAKDSAGK